MHRGEMLPLQNEVRHQSCATRAALANWRTFQKAAGKICFMGKDYSAEKNKLQRSQLLQDSILVFPLYSIIPDDHVREIWKHRFIKRTSAKYNTMGYLTEADNILQILCEQIVKSKQQVSPRTNFYSISGTESYLWLLLVQACNGHLLN